MDTPDFIARSNWLSAAALALLLFRRRIQCEFRRNPAGDSDLMSAAVPI
jgi:hypothetical protein